MKDKQGNQITISEFLSRWKEGMKAVTPLQQLKINNYGYILVLIGVVIGLYSTIKANVWWLVIILLGSLFVTGVALFGNVQRMIILSEQEKLIKQYEEENNVKQ